MKPFDSHKYVFSVEMVMYYIFLALLIIGELFCIQYSYHYILSSYFSKSPDFIYDIIGALFSTIGLGAVIYCLYCKVGPHLKIKYLIRFANNHAFAARLDTYSELNLLKAFLVIRNKNINDDKLSIVLDKLRDDEMLDEDELSKKEFICYDYEVYNPPNRAQVIVTRKLMIIRYIMTFAKDDILHLDRINEIKMNKIEKAGLLASMKDMTKIVITYKNTKKKWTLYSKDEEFLTMLEQTGKCVR